MSLRTSRRSFIKPILVFCLLLVIVAIGYDKFHDRSVPIQVRHTTQKTSAAPVIPPATHDDVQLQKIIDTWATKHSFTSAVVATELSGQLRTASRASNSVMVTASTYKIFVAYAALHQVEQGKIKLSTATRTGQTVQQALNKMILQSDNDSAEALGFLIGWDSIDAQVANVGAIHTDINNYDASGQPVNGDKHSTTADLALMLTKLQQGSLLNTTDSQQLLSLMKNQVWRERVPAGVPSGIAVADKPGWLSNVQNDAAIIYGPKSTYVLVIMTNASTTSPLADLSSQIYTYLEG